MNLGQMKSRVRRELNETTTTFFSDDDIERSLREGYDELADATEWFERVAHVPMLEGRTYYDLSLILDDTFLSPRRIYNPVTDRWLEPTDPLQLDKTYSQWEIVEGQPTHYWLRGNWWLGVWPRPSVDSPGLRLVYTAITAGLDSDDAEPEFPVEFHQGITEYADYDLMAQRREWQKAERFWGRYKGFEGRLQMYVEGRTKLAASGGLSGGQY